MQNMIKVLIVDDSTTTRSMIVKYLGNGYDCIEAGNGEEGWTMLQKDERISLVFADMHMPVLNGMLLLKRMRESDIERLSSMPVIMITGVDDTDAAKRASYNLGATDFLSKPFDRTDILCHAGSYTRTGRAITQAETETAQNVLAGLHENPVVAEFGNKAISFAERHENHVSVMYVQIVGIEALVETHGSKLIDQAATRIMELFNESLRKEEIVAAISEGKFVIALPATKAFKANIVANRLQQAVSRLSFQLPGCTLKLDIAIGLTSTESGETNARYLTFGEYCIQAQHALNLSLESRNNRIVRYDETYEKKVEDHSSTLAAISMPAFGQQDADDSDEAAMDNFAEFFSYIMMGDYSKIPAEYLGMFITPLEKFLDYARDASGKDASGSEEKQITG